MTLKEQLEILRGEPIQVYEGDPMDIPCIETSDAEKLCKNPVVSVHMITYNHEPYIRQAIEGVMMQKTDFEFELIIGEDASQDKTREICFEYQKKYPDKIRVLWWHENVSKLGGNSRRVFARCRGEFIAICEGDDYWIDPLKLQKQVDVMRSNTDVGLCFCGSKIFNQNTQKINGSVNSRFPAGKIISEFFLDTYLADVSPKKVKEGITHIMTATVMLRSFDLRQCFKKFDIFKWNLMLGDKIIWLAIASLSNIFFIKDIVSVYREQSRGLMATVGDQVYRDSAIVSFYYIRKIHDMIPFTNKRYRANYVLSLILFSQPRQPSNQQKENYKRCQTIEEVKRLFTYWNNKIFKVLWKYGLFRQWMIPYCTKYLYFRVNTFSKIKFKIKSIVRRV